MLSIKIKIKLIKVSFIVIACSVWGILVSLMEHAMRSEIPLTNLNQYSFRSSLLANLLGGVIGGIVFGIFEIFIFEKTFSKSSFYKSVIAKSSLYLFLNFIFLLVGSLIYTLDHTGESIFSSEVWGMIGRYLSSAGPLFIFVSWGTIFILIIFFLNISKRFGSGVLPNIILGKYHTPKEEWRIFMFLDLTSSTPIAEKLGNKKYYEFLNDFFSDVADPVMYSKGEIYQYVGDEVTLSWTLQNGRERENCVRCFFDIKDRILQRRAYYKSRYNLLPEFKAGMHFGSVTIGEVGILKKAIVFSGDVLNTTARIRSECSALNKQLLVSRNLLSIIYLDDAYSINKIGFAELRGKSKKTELYSIDQEKL